ncbi:hypothetical protein QBC46DRAFT_274280 [Diplogelasinospora grovesii]|uniref:F-box domain-containing protein n=1 Tax=Diplogelasinospora grovesii TaxID=303347 RepID=A0AAN6MVR1_9PEZI|nr:hypothetical protein QBC46DRAFT_274280 [Diplogelasinospora grovesii]
MDSLPLEMLALVASHLTHSNLYNFRLINCYFALAAYLIVTHYISLLNTLSCLKDFLADVR